MVSTKKEDTGAVNLSLSQTDSVLYKSSTGLAAKEKLYKVMVAGQATEAQKATAKTVIEEVVDRFTFEIQRLQSVVDSYDSKIQKDKKEIKLENEKIAEFIKEIERKEMKIMELQRETKTQREQFTVLKDTHSRGKHIWEVERKDLIPKLEKETAENRSNLQRVEQQILIIAELERQNAELKELAEKRYKGFIQLQEQQRAERADQVAFMRLQTECEGAKKKLADLEEFMKREEMEFKVKIEQLSENNENLVEECKGYKRRIKDLEEEKWRVNLNTDLNENMFENSLIKDSILRIGHEEIIKRGKIIENSFLASPVISKQNNNSIVRDLTFELVDAERQLVIEDVKSKPELLIQKSADLDHSLQIIENDNISSDNDINLTDDNIKGDRRVIVEKTDFSSQTERYSEDMAVGFNEGSDYVLKVEALEPKKQELSLTDLYLKQIYTKEPSTLVDMSVQASVATREESTSCEVETHQNKNPISESDFFGSPVPTKQELRTTDLCTLIKNLKRSRHLRSYVYTVLSLNSKPALLEEGETQTDALAEISIIEDGHKNPSNMVNTSYFDASQAFIDNLHLNLQRADEPNPILARPQSVREIEKPMVLIRKEHREKEFGIFGVNKYDNFGVYYLRESEMYQEPLLGERDPMSTALLIDQFYTPHELSKSEPVAVAETKSIRTLALAHTMNIISQSREDAIEKAMYELTTKTVFSRESTNAGDTSESQRENTEQLVAEYKSKIEALQEEHNRTIVDLHEHYKAQIESLVNKASDRPSELTVQFTHAYRQKKVEIEEPPVVPKKQKNDLQPAVFSLNSLKSNRKLEVNLQETIVSQESRRSLKGSTSPVIIYANLSEATQKERVDVQAELQVREELALAHESHISKIKTEMGQQIQLLEQEFKKKNQFIEAEFNSRLVQVKSEKDQEIQELNQEIAVKKAEVKDKRELKRQVEQQKMEITQLQTERDSYVIKLEQLVGEKDQLEQRLTELSQNQDKNGEEHNVKLQEQIVNNKKILEQLKILQEAKRKADNRCMELQTENDELERKVNETKAPTQMDPFEVFNLEASRLDSQEDQHIFSSRDISQQIEMQMVRSSTMGNLNKLPPKPLQDTPMKKMPTFANNFEVDNGSLATDSERKKYRLSLWESKDEKKSSDVSLQVDNSVLKNPSMTFMAKDPKPAVVREQTNIGKIVKVKEISHILNQKRHDGKEDYVEKAKTYSYDYINIKKCFGLLEIIHTFQKLENIDEWFTDIVYRLNSWTNKKKKLLVLTDQNLFIFNSKTALKRRIALKDITKLKHSQKNNYIGLSARNIEEEVLETYRKEEFILFLKKKMKNLGLGLKITEQTNFEKRNRITEEQYYNPTIMKKFRPHYTETFSLAAQCHQIGYITTEHKELFGLVDSAREYLCLLTNMGVICFTRKEFKVSDFLPLVGTKVLISDHSALNLKLILCDRTERTLAFNSVNDKNAWYDMLNKNIKKLVEMIG